jgi:hypothetical protein
MGSTGLQAAAVCLLYLTLRLLLKCLNTQNAFQSLKREYYRHIAYSFYFRLTDDIIDSRRG